MLDANGVLVDLKRKLVLGTITKYLLDQSAKILVLYDRYTKKKKKKKKKSKKR